MYYPTKKEILAQMKKTQIDTFTTASIYSWKRNFLHNWKQKSNEEKISDLNYLLLSLEQNHLQIDTASQYSYNPTTKTIYHDQNNPSIISSLHELAHHFYGPSELIACAWSILLFKTCFPGLYKKLEWKNHLLVKK